MKRLRIMKSYTVLWLFIFFLIYSNLEQITVFFMATLTFNLAVLTILTIGIIMLMRASINLVMLAGTFGILAYKKDNLNFYLKGIEKIMPANIAHMFHSRADKGVMLFTAEESRDVIDWIEEKFFNQNRYTNYFIGTALMIGLLGTFTGLLIAIDDMGRIILSLSGDIDLGKVISEFSGPLGGMAVGFGSSLFGVVSAIILGLKGYILNKNQETLIEGVEDWLKGRIINVASSASTSGFDGGSDLPDQKSSFMDVFVDQISSMTTEMRNLSQNSERLHSITIASVQQARNEHELTISVMEGMHKSLENIDTHSQQTAQMLKEQFHLLSENIHTEQDQALETYGQNVEALFTRLETALLGAQTSISNEFSKLSHENEKLSTQQINQLDTTLTKIDQRLSEEKTTLDRLLHENMHSWTDHKEHLNDIADLLQQSYSALTQEQETLKHLHQQLQINDENASAHMNNIISSVARVGETLELEVKQLGNMEDVQRLQNESFERNLLLLNEMKETLIKNEATNRSAIEHIDGLKDELSNVSKDIVEGSNTGLQHVALEIQNLHQLMREGEKRQETLLSEQQTLNALSQKGNEILDNILRDQKEQMQSLLGQQEKMFNQQQNLLALSKDTLTQENENFKVLQDQAKASLQEQNGFREEHRMLLSLTQRSSDLSEEAAGMTLDKSIENLEAIERLIQENQSIKAEIQNLNETIRKKSFGSGNNSDSFISKLFK